MIGANVTELISEIIVARKLETTAHEIINLYIRILQCRKQ